MNVLFTNAGRRTYIIDYALKLKKLKVFITETEKYSPVSLHKKVKQYLTIKVTKDPKKYLKQILNIVAKERIKKIIPLSDHDLEILSQNRTFFLNIGCDIIVSNPSTIKNCINKKLMHKHCLKNKISTPISLFSSKKKIVISNTFIKKKIKGSGGKDMEILGKNSNLKKINFEKFFIQKRIIGDEFGVDIFSIKEKSLSRICIKKKILMRSGETDRSIIINNKKIIKFCKIILNYFPVYGNLDCDLIMDKRGKIYLIDLNPRFGGGYPATHEAGLKYLYYLLKKDFQIPKIPIKKIVSKGINIFSKKI